VTGTRPASRFASRPHPRHDKRTDIAKSVLAIAARVLENVTLGRIYDAKTVEWANHIVKANAS
jgi:hypothetical protein